MTDDANSASSEEATGRDAAAETSAEAAPDAATTADSPSVDDVQRQRDEYYDLLLRKTAEFDNYRKRSDRERRDLLESAGAAVLEQLLPIVDDLERALEAQSGDERADAYRQGVEIIHRQLLDLLRKHQVTPMEVVGADFDPHVHQAVAHEPSAAHRDGEVIAEMRRGYRLGERLLRPAMVRVAKGE
ncbi:MAG: nucleotide exchange factor GrpE [Vicinamibacterales bacterium]|jgi:molecular chaperone GrpE|nr:nucleotide exchange factor GrpE [Acidobacteriota bacterium]MDP7472765.1 nucleotide exchange factor GrpE [Vicinamibacterales bacterium]MDP7671434.1 nucleotide exchange factor GrpE [Vicinamibacterales bacterium]HJO38908.1 nucleotide exchange factor GrpE [Vicinamibacterales bacterium]|tara:strand:+ start:4194 stop:4754 length:561 start_codon:yes stop_codon:yes gene_type:complete